MKRLISLLLVIVFPTLAFAATTYTSTQSGLFSANATWGGAGHPDTDGQTWTIATGHQVVYDMDVSAFPNGFGASVVTGTLLITNQAAQVFLRMNGNISGAGSWQIGSTTQPVTNMPDALPAIVIAWKSGSCTMNGNGVIAWYAATNSFLDYLTNTAAIGTSNLVFASTPVNLASNDVIYVSEPKTAGLGGSVHVVYSVNQNTVTVFNAISGSAASVTNTYYGLVMGTTFATTDRTNNALVVKVSRPVVSMQPTALNVGTFTASNTNILSGIRFANSYDANNALNGCSLTNCAATTMTYGFITSGIGNNLVGCVAVKGGNGGIAYSTGSYNNFYSCIAVNCSSGGIANIGYGYNILNCIAANNSNGGITYWGSGHVISNCVSYNCSCGISDFGSGFYIVNCATTNCTTGGIAALGMSHNIVNCTAFNYGNVGGIMDSGSGTIINCSAYGGATAGAPIIAYNPCESVIYGSGNRVAWVGSGTLDVLYTSAFHAPFDVTVINGTNWLNAGGMTYVTNIAQSFSTNVIFHSPVLTNSPVSYYYPIGIKPYSTHRAILSLYLTNTGRFDYQVTSDHYKPVSPTSIYGTGGWTNLSIILTNSLPVPSTKWLWVSSYSTNALYPQMSWVAPQTDYQSAIMP